MVARDEEIQILEKVFDLAKRELNPIEYAKFLTIITPKIGDSVRELRKLPQKLLHREDSSLTTTSAE